MKNNDTTAPPKADITFAQWIAAEAKAGRPRLAWAGSTQEDWEKFQVTQASPLAPMPEVEKDASSQQVSQVIANMRPHGSSSNTVKKSY